MFWPDHPPLLCAISVALTRHWGNTESGKNKSCFIHVCYMYSLVLKCSEPIVWLIKHWAWRSLLTVKKRRNPFFQSMEFILVMWVKCTLCPNVYQPASAELFMQKEISKCEKIKCWWAMMTPMQLDFSFSFSAWRTGWKMLSHCGNVLPLYNLNSEDGRCLLHWYEAPRELFNIKRAAFFCVRQQNNYSLVKHIKPE